MGDAEYTFNATNRERAIIKGSARYKKNGRRSKGCTLPSDYLTPAQKRKLNGGVITMNMNRPMDYRTLKTYSEDLQKEYLLNIISRFNATGNVLSAMLGVSVPTVNRLRRELGIPETDEFRRRMSNKQKEIFEDWLTSDGETEEAVEEVEDINTEPEEDVCSYTPTPAFPEITSGTITLTGKPMLILDRLHWLFSSCAEDYTICLSWEKEDA